MMRSGTEKGSPSAKVPFPSSPPDEENAPPAIVVVTNVAARRARWKSGCSTNRNRRLFHRGAGGGNGGGGAKGSSDDMRAAVISQPEAREGAPTFERQAPEFSSGRRNRDSRLAADAAPRATRAKSSSGIGSPIRSAKRSPATESRTRMGNTAQARSPFARESSLG